jgi:hypothetical protein
MCTVISAAYGKQVSQFSQTCVLCFSSVSAKQNLFLHGKRLFGEEELSHARSFSVSSYMFWTLVAHFIGWL